MADERYRRLLGIEPAGEIPTHYELLLVDRSETDATVLEGAYKEQMKKLQQIRSSKDKGFIEFLKEELRTARLTLTNPDRRKAYDESLIQDAAQSFREWVKPMMALGLVPQGVHDTMVQKGVHDGLTPESAAQVIREVAAECGATLEADGTAPAAAPAPSAPAAVAVAAPAAPEPVFEDEPVVSDDHDYDEASVEEPTFTDDIDPGTEPLPTREPPARAAPPAARTPAPAAPEAGGSKVARNRGFYEQGAPWSRGGGGRAPSAPEARPEARPAASSRTPASTPAGRPVAAGRQAAESSVTQRQRWNKQHDQSAVSEAARLFNLGAKLAKVAGEVHHQLQYYFPPANGRTTITYQRGGVSYEKVFETEQKTYRDALQKFQSAMERLGDLNGAQADELRTHANQRITLIKGILDEIRQHKLRQLAGLSKAEELRMWQAFVGSPRSARLGQSIGEG